MKRVALFTRAWIEIKTKTIYRVQVGVALFTRAWIEIKIFTNFCHGKWVALFTRAWIEIVLKTSLAKVLYCRPLHEGVD